MKQCFQCGLLKELDEFYKHEGMDDGHLGKCKECAKEYARGLRSDPSKRERIREYDKKRTSDHNRLQWRKEYRKLYRQRAIIKIKAHMIVYRMVKNGTLKKQPCEICGGLNSEAHHADYTKPEIVRWFCFKHHRETHNQIVGRL